MKPIGDMLDKNITLVGADVLTLRGYTQVPNAVLRCEEISAGAKLAYTMLLSYAWHNDFCFPGQERLAKDMGVHRSTANVHIQELAKKGFVKITRRGQGKSNLYEVNLKAKVLKTK